MREGLVDANPVAFTNKPSKAVARERILAGDELRDIWRTLGDDDYGDILRLLTLTGARPVLVSRSAIITPSGRDARFPTETRPRP